MTPSPLPSSGISPSSPTRIAVLLTCFNRKQNTLDCFAALSANTGIDQVQLSVVLVDDGSTDGTAEAVNAAFPWVQVVRGSGNLFWCRGMHQAFATALRDDYDFYLWLNDDTMLQPDALARLLRCEAELRTKQGKPVIVVGSTIDPVTGVVTYGGELQVSSIKRTTFVRIKPDDQPHLCDSMTGNIVLISRAAAQIVGNLDPAFEHAMGDTDYALRARKLGVGVWVGPGVYGTCSDNPPTGTYMDSSLPMSRRWKLMLNRKGLPWRSWLVLTRRHMGLLWPLYFSWPYLSLLSGRYQRGRRK
ncbi:GT2 family glycosyltransferase [Actimicrobium sp. GrIS 1.19]|uniref:glycosyltransferase family 2 protein n=1 Tax=Actimicrobium sp. GrIS 1.19 TaxID=3071708 RepID=UPI002E00C145|nr:GT2 family glycosyltransferase [Actimicrobium sp. GrIS 1.19]